MKRGALAAALLRLAPAGIARGSDEGATREIVAAIDRGPIGMRHAEGLLGME